MKNGDVERVKAETAGKDAAEPERRPADQPAAPQTSAAGTRVLAGESKRSWASRRADGPAWGDGVEQF